MSLKDFFNFNQGGKTDYSVNLCFSFAYGDKNFKFAEVFTVEIFRKILTDCYEHAADFPKGKEIALWDSVVFTQARRGLISILAHAMTHKEKLYLKLDEGCVRKATEAEKKEIDADPSGKKGLCVDFTDFHRATIVLILASLVELLLNNANTSLNVSKSILLKINALRENVANANAGEVIEQAKAIAQGLKNGTGGLLDAGDVVELPTFDTNPMEQALDVLYGLMSFITGLPRAYISGELTTGLSTTGEADEKGIERGLTFYFNSIFKPVCDKLLGGNLVFKTSNWRKFAEVANLLPVLEATDMVPADYKEKLIKELFG